MARGRGRRSDDEVAVALEDERRERLRREEERIEAERRDGLAPAGGARAMLAALDWPDSEAWDPDDSLEELARLVETAGGTVAGRMTQRRDHPDPATFFGRGKAAELADARIDPGYDLLVVDSELSPSQQRNLEKRIDGPVLDRPGLIIEIFGQRASTREARLQVELARLEYLLPRLAGAWSHLERQVGGIGARGGPGERQIELDRRLVRDRIAALKREIAQVRAHRARARTNRDEKGPPLVALVGYTNAGKSSLMNVLTEAGVTAEDKLFATLDPTTRRMSLPGGGYAVISDTVGFIQNLPPQLIAAFRATLEELESAHLLLHVIDAAHPNAHEQQTAVQSILDDLGLGDKPTLLVLNKADLLAEPVKLKGDWGVPDEDAVVVSAETGFGIGALRARIARRLGMEVREVEVDLPFSAGRLVAIFRREGFLIREEHRPHGVRLHGHLPERLIPAFRRVGKVREVKTAASAGWR